MRRVKSVLPLALFLPLILSACNTIENRRSVYSPTKVDGPYTRSLRDGTWADDKPVDAQYAQAKKNKKAAPAVVAPAPAVTAPAVEAQ